MHHAQTHSGSLESRSTPHPSALRSTRRRQEAPRSGRTEEVFGGSPAALSSARTATLPHDDKVQLRSSREGRIRKGHASEAKALTLGRRDPRPWPFFLLSNLNENYSNLDQNYRKFLSPRKPLSHPHPHAQESTRSSAFRALRQIVPQLTCCAEHTSRSEGPPSSDTPHRSCTVHRIPQGPW